MKELKNLKGTKVLSKKEQMNIKGGREICDVFGHDCHEGYVCILVNSTTGWCWPVLPELEP